MSTGGARLWWLYGSPCAGKSVTAWQLHAHLLAGRPRAYFDVDQVGMCYPERDDDPDRYALKARAAGALVRRLVAAGAGTVVVSGVLDRHSMHAVLTEETRGVAVTFCRVRVDRGELTRRLQARYDPDDVERALDEARAADGRGDGHPTVDSGDGPPEAVAERALQLLETVGPAAPATAGADDGHAQRWPAETPAPEPTTLEPTTPETTTAEPVAVEAVAVLVCGPVGVGKSTAGFGFFSALLATGRPSSYLDLQQLSFLRDVPGPVDDRGRHRLTAACVADVWDHHRLAGSRTLVLSGHVETVEDVAHYRAALGDVPLLVCRLRAQRGALLTRLLERTRGRGPHLAGDALVGMDVEQVQDVVELALAQQERLDEVEVADTVLDTDALDADSVTERLVSWVDDVR